jgi:hypothetical protein
MSLSRALRAMVLAITLGLPCAASADAPAPIAFSVHFAPDARLGHVTPMTLRVAIDPSYAPLTEFRLLTPPGISLADSRLGAAACRRSQDEITRVMSPVIRHGLCPGNSLMGTGTATAGLLLSDERTLFGAATIELHSGGTVAGKPGLLVTADTYNPARIQLAYAGYLYVPPAPFELGMAILVRAIPRPPFGAAVALSTLDLTVGAPSLTYHRTSGGRRASYHPGGIPLPASCPARGFRFRAVMLFADAIRRSVNSYAPCPLS